MSDHESIPHLTEADLNKLRSVLQKVAQNYTKDSAEYQALATATKALHYVSHQKLTKEFSQYIYPTLTDDQKDHLKRMGYELDQTP
jgi:hypothetical protein